MSRTLAKRRNMHQNYATCQLKPNGSSRVPVGKVAPPFSALTRPDSNEAAAEVVSPMYKSSDLPELGRLACHHICNPSRRVKKTSHHQLSRDGAQLNAPTFEMFCDSGELKKYPSSGQRHAHTTEGMLAENGEAHRQLSGVGRLLVR